MKITLILAAFVAATSAHMRMSDPPAIHAVENQYGDKADQREPLMGPDQFPCRGYGSLLGSGPGTPVAQWEAGSTQKFKTIGAPPPEYQASHGGGSCQVSFSTDQGKTFRVVKSFIGGCPALTDQQNNGHGTPVLSGFLFNVPKDLPAGPVLFAWTWFNHIGNREMYMNCAAVEITGTAGKDDIAFEDRPEIFVANLPPDAGVCAVPSDGDADFPNPGNDVQVLENAIRVEPTGSCGTVNRDPAKETKITAEKLLAGDSSAPSTPGTVTESPAGVADGNRKAEVISPAAPADPPYVAPVAPVAAPPAAVAAPLPAGNTCPQSENGYWNCIDGKTFSQCASGTWSIPMPVAPGTECVVGRGPNIDIKATPMLKRSIRFSQPHVRRHAARYRS